MDASNCGYYSDRIFNAHNSASRFYVATFGYAKAWKEHNTHERQIDRYTVHFVFSGCGTFNGQPIKAGQMFFAPQNQKYTNTAYGRRRINTHFLRAIGGIIRTP